MTDFIVHGIPGSPFVRAVLLALEEKGLAWRLAGIPMGAHRAPDYAAIHPFHKIPSLDHGDFRLYETTAILGYLDRAAATNPLTPTDTQAHARMDQLISIALCYVTPTISGAISFPRRVAPLVGVQVDDSAVAAAIPAAQQTMEELARLLGDQPFFTGDALSLADLMLVPHLAFLTDFDEGRALIADHANIAAWVARMEARSSMAATSWDRLIALSGVNNKVATELAA
ncbi:MAG: putative glutathione S-transferase [Sphingomonas bacterium]|uniref:glutathione S-transferase family protein n=1 Tax=Sphingomonas bacterium TaxID=1895847 RepID=UPI00261767E2|nr:glutathione S-transferase family protein [Sphingomonas bacterium]MDB5712303.1 putative glutathione S-transferase [Sphingomonas bacterium]